MKLNIEGGKYELLERLLEIGSINIINHIKIQFPAVGEESESRIKKYVVNYQRPICAPIVIDSFGKSGRGV